MSLDGFFEDAVDFFGTEVLDLHQFVLGLGSSAQTHCGLLQPKGGAHELYQLLVGFPILRRGRD